MQETDIVEKIAHIDERTKSNTKRLDEHDSRLDNLERTYSIMEKMDYRIGKMESAVDKIDSKLDSKINEDSNSKGKKWDKLIDYIFYTILGAIMLMVLAKVGLN